MQNINFLMPLKGTSTKTFNYDGAWNLKKNYQAGKYFKGFEIPVNNLEEFYDLLKENQNYNVFMIHGGFIDGIDLNNMHRKKRGDEPTIVNRPVHLFCLDVDGYKGNLKEFMRELPEPFKQASFIYQYSSSFALTSPHTILKCHIFFWLEKPVYNNEIKDWIKSFNEFKNWGRVIDYSVLNAAQPLYIQKRICEGAPDPIPEDKFIGFINKCINLECLPMQAESRGETLPIPKSTDSFDLKASVEKILKEESYHDEIRSLALSLANNKIPRKIIKSLIEGAMNSAAVKDDRWQDRFNDIDRAIESAFGIVKNLSLDEVIDWILATDSKEVRIGYASKLLGLSPLDKTTAIKEVCAKIGCGLADAKRELKLAEQEAALESQKTMREAISIERKMNGIHEIEINATNSSEVVYRINKILSESKKDPNVFIIGGCLAKVSLGVPKTIRQISKKNELGIDYPKIPIIIPYRKPFYSLQHRIQQDVIFQDGSGKDIEPSIKIIHEVGQAEYNGFKPLSGIVENPFINHNWSLIQKEGYDERTGLFTMLHHKLKIKKMHPKDAWNYLAETVFDEFPFASDLDLAVAIGCMLTCAMRPTISADTAGMPGFGIVSPTQSSGKTTLAQLISNSIFNRPIASTSWTHDEEELGKHLLAILQEGHSCVIFDNIQQGASVKSERLSTAMSSDVFSGRQLGENKNVEVPSSVIWMFTGNGISFVGDFATRIYPINLNPKMADPNTRKFKRDDIGQWAMDNRKHIISAVLSLVIAGKDEPEMESGSRFKLWDKFVRRPIYKVSKIDINEAVLINQKSDPDKLVKDNLLSQLFDTFNTDKFTTKDIIKRAFGAFESGDTDLGDALTDFVGDKAKNSKSLGRFLSSIVGGVFGNLMLEKTTSNMVYWNIKEVV